MEKRPRSYKFEPLDEMSINTLRFLAVDAVEAANSGHPGMPMGDAPMAYVLWRRILRHNPSNPQWPARDRFVLSAGHGSMLLYALLHLSGYPLPIDEIKRFRQWGSHTPGHPEHDPKIGIETTTGPLGQGFANGVGMAMAQKYLAHRFNRPGYPLFDYDIYAICSDGDIMEGVSNEAASIAGHLKLGNIIYLYSDNRITIEGKTDLSMSEDAGKRFEALGWHVQHVGGNDLGAIALAIESAKEERTRPSIIIARTIIGFGSPGKQDTAEVHGAPLGKDEVRATKEKLGWPLEPEFFIPEEVLKDFRELLPRGEALEREWLSMLEKYEKEYPEEGREVRAIMNGTRDSAWMGKLPSFAEKDGAVATRSASGKVLNAIAASAPFLIGGSADLAPSTNTLMKGMGNFLPTGVGRNLHFGVREHAMGSLLNGMALTKGVVPYGATFLIFSDYMKPAIRLAALMGLQVVYVFTHDSIGLGEDGPTHQPVEQLAGLRAIPNLTVIRPADANETAEAWKAALLNETGPTALVLTRQGVPVIDRTKYAPAEGLSKGAYVLADPREGKPEVIIMATGSEVQLAVAAYEDLSKRGVRARVVNMPSWELFEAQDDAYKSSVFPQDVRVRVAVEAASPMGWHRYTGIDGAVIGIDRFGASAPYKIVFEKYGLTAGNVAEKALALLNAKKGRFVDGI
ncbi:MAG: transketolase [Thermodesulfobacteriota bacterium]|nr:MAG: transketolase [Thermodesulfobacteriota bacterium]